MATVIAIVVIAALVVLALAGVRYYQSLRRHKRMQERFGPEYEHLREQEGRGSAERELEGREKRVERLNIRHLAPEERERFSGEWQRIQARFVDDPRSAMVDADILCQDVMRTRGYPISDFERQQADISVQHPVVARNYRQAHEISEASRENRASTEQLRQGMLNYRALFDDLLEATAARGDSRASERGDRRLREATRQSHESPPSIDFRCRAPRHVRILLTALARALFEEEYRLIH